MYHKLKYILNFCIGNLLFFGYWFLIYYIGVISSVWVFTVLSVFSLSSALKTLRTLPYEIIGLYKVFKSKKPHVIIENISELRANRELWKIKNL